MKIYHYGNKSYTTLPDPLHTEAGEVSPMSEKLFKQLGGVVHDDGQPTPEQRVCEEFAELIEDLASKTDKITPEEFLQAAQNGISSNLITLARSKGVSEDVIDEGRTRIVEIMADAMRFGMTWAELIAGVVPK
jgi:predicted PhzF superfamily epimerase YddE/YHI9